MMADAFKLAVLARQSHNVTPPAGFQMLLLLCMGRESQGIQRILSNTKESNSIQGILPNPKESEHIHGILATVNFVHDDADCSVSCWAFGLGFGFPG